MRLRRLHSGGLGGARRGRVGLGGGRAGCGGLMIGRGASSSAMCCSVRR